MGLRAATPTPAIPNIKVVPETTPRDSNRDGCEHGKEDTDQSDHYT